MRKIIIPFLSLSFFVIASPILGQQSNIKPLRTLIIDPGHGGQDPGAKGTLESEANVALAISLKLGDTIAKAFPEIKIHYTRTTDILPGNLTNLDASLKYRANLANDNNGDLFIAIHCNSAGKAPGGWYERRVVGKTPYTKTVKKGKKTVKQTAYKYEYDNVWVENKAMPSILIEIGFISNKEEEAYMLSPEGQKEIVGNIFTALKKYKEKLEEKAAKSAENKEKKSF